MSDPTSKRVQWSDAHRHFFTHLAVMPAWHKAVILIAGALAIFGTIGQIVAKAGGDARVHVSTPGTSTPAGDFLVAF